MNKEKFLALVAERDEELGIFTEGMSSSFYSEAPDTVSTLYNGDRPVKFFNGSVAEKVETLDRFSSDYDGSRAGNGWDSSYASGETFIVKVTPAPSFTVTSPDYFKITGFFDSWDNGKDDKFLYSEIVQVKPVPVDKVDWKEVE